MEATMGVWGWYEITDYVSCKAHALKAGDNDDRDLSLFIKPTPDYAWLAGNPLTSGLFNLDGVVECEFEASHDLDLDSILVNLRYLISKGELTLIGTWSIDKSHYASGGSISSPGGSASLGKTELHPLSAIIVDPETSLPVKNVEIFLFGEDSEAHWYDPQRPSSVPHTKENRILDTMIRFPPSPEDDMRPTQSVITYLDRSATKSLSIVPNGPEYFSKIYITTGDGDGYFHASLVLEHDSSTQHVYFGIFSSAPHPLYGSSLYGSSIGSSTQWTIHRADLGTALSFINKKFQAGVPPARVRTYIENNQRFWDVICFGNKGASWIIANVTIDGFLEKYKEFYGKLSLVDFDTYLDGGVRLWTGIWQQIQEPNAFLSNYLFEDFLSQVQMLSDNGVPLSRFKTYVQNGQRRWAGICSGGNIERRFYPDMSFDQFKIRWGEYYGKYCLIDIQTYIESGQRRWAGLWERSDAANRIVWGYNLESFIKEIQNTSEAGMQLTHLTVYRNV
jgi:hypothetical protein